MQYPQNLACSSKAGMSLGAAEEIESAQWGIEKKKNQGFQFQPTWYINKNGKYFIVQALHADLVKQTKYFEQILPRDFQFLQCFS